MILSEHLVRCDTDGIDYKTPWYLWTVGRLQQIFMMVGAFAFLKLKLKLKQLNGEIVASLRQLQPSACRSSANFRVVTYDFKRSVYFT